MNKVIYINPSDISKMSRIGGWKGTCHRKFSERGLVFHEGYVNGDWDMNCELFKDSRFYKDLMLYIEYGHEIAKTMYSGYYDWHSLFQSIVTNGYVQKEEDRCVEVCIGREGEYLFVDGRHRLAIALYLKIEKIPVKVMYKHQNTK
jgi:hypothetical protein